MKSDGIGRMFMIGGAGAKRKSRCAGQQAAAARVLGTVEAIAPVSITLPAKSCRAAKHSCVAVGPRCSLGNPGAGAGGMSRPRSEQKQAGGCGGTCFKYGAVERGTTTLLVTPMTYTASLIAQIAS